MLLVERYVTQNNWEVYFPKFFGDQRRNSINKISHKP